MRTVCLGHAQVGQTCVVIATDGSTLSKLRDIAPNLASAHEVEQSAVDQLRLVCGLERLARNGRGSAVRRGCRTQLTPASIEPSLRVDAQRTVGIHPAL